MRARSSSSAAGSTFNAWPRFSFRSLSWYNLAQPHTPMSADRKRVGQACLQSRQRSEGRDSEWGGPSRKLFIPVGDLIIAHRTGYRLVTLSCHVKDEGADQNSARATGSAARRTVITHDTVEDQATLSDFSTTRITLQVNGVSRTLEIEPRVSILDALREYLNLPGTKKGCNQGACGACTVLCDGDRILSCLALAVQYEGAEITTIEGLSTNGELHPMQAAMIEHDGFQCGYCTPGQICSAIGMVEELRNGLPSAVTKDVSSNNIEFSEEEIKERMSGNLCRCGAYLGIRAAILDAFKSQATR